MVSDDESDSKREDWELEFNSWLYLRICEEKEAGTRGIYSRQLRRTLADCEESEATHTSEKEESDRWLSEELKLVRALRFFGSLEGFYKGDLDFSGRRPKKWHSLWMRWGTFCRPLGNLIAVFKNLPRYLDSEGQVLELEIEDENF
ncbi:hypothetical protein M422DRAFT_269477 [Sphaerobolus stellatus SS14]|uniref:Uncharacterized protein n=1 Tax=Sphaerobolus stellatus (strain SS14) TaxID=990650 RepID=A0A0C9UVC6_SPHS4|nr:hypothetical protein M422DRAFT_269477 [Sphaerobolus stellatus SS14]